MDCTGSTGAGEHHYQNSSTCSWGCWQRQQSLSPTWPSRLWMWGSTARAGSPRVRAVQTAWGSCWRLLGGLSRWVQAVSLPLAGGSPSACLLWKGSLWRSASWGVPVQSPAQLPDKQLVSEGSVYGWVNSSPFERLEQFILRKSEDESPPMVIPMGTLKGAGCFLSCTCLFSESVKAAKPQLRKIHPLVLERKIKLAVN